MLTIWLLLPFLSIVLPSPFYSGAPDNFDVAQAEHIYHTIHAIAADYRIPPETRIHEIYKMFTTCFHLINRGGPVDEETIHSMATGIAKGLVEVSLSNFHSNMMMCGLQAAQEIADVVRDSSLLKGEADLNLNNMIAMIKRQHNC